jgi:hypothetical protein
MEMTVSFFRIQVADQGLDQRLHVIQTMRFAGASLSRSVACPQTHALRPRLLKSRRTPFKHLPKAQDIKPALKNVLVFDELNCFAYRHEQIPSNDY